MTIQGKFAALALSALALAVVAPKVGPHASLAGSSARVYTVKPSDTLWAIANRFYQGDPRAGIWRIEQRNHLSSSDVSPGQTLVLP